MTSLPVRAAFSRVEPVKLDSLIQGAIQGTTGLPIPVPLPQRRPPNGHSTWLPKRFVVEVAEDEVKILDETGEGVEDAWARGHVDARVRVLDDHEVVVELRWPGADRHGRIEAEPTAEARAIAELLAHDTRVAQGSDRETDAALMSLAAETLPAELRRDRQAALRAIAVLVAPGERPLVVAEAASGVSFGIALLTDRTLNWWSGGRKEPVVVPRAEIVEAVVERPEDYGDLAVTDAGGRKIVLESLTPRDHASAIAELLGAELPEPAAPGLHAFLAATDEGLTRELRRELELLAALWDDGEEGRVLAIGFVGARIGALMLTDRRLLWAARKAEPISIERSAIAAPRLTRKLGAMRLDLTLPGGGEQRFDAVTPRERAEAMAAALLA